MDPIRKEFQYGDHTVTLETGEIARQPHGAVIIDVEGTSLLVTVVSKKDTGGNDFFPLTVNYQEKSYAAGKIPGGFFKREGRPSEQETLISRLIDRPMRPMFPEGYTDEVQIIATSCQRCTKAAGGGFQVRCGGWRQTGEYSLSG